MCGIAGFYGFNDDKLLKRFSKQLQHRGPDGEGIYRDSEVSLLNRRLAIIDVKGGDQPIYNEDGSVVVVYNGEIYNYQELKEKLKKLGHKFKTKSDTEVIVHGYEQWDNHVFDLLNGMFAIALRDSKKNKLILARDHFGIKPLYYSLINPNDKIKNLKVVFSSEIKPIHLSGLVRTAPNDRIICRYLKYRVHDDGRETFFKNIYRLLPGELAEISYGKLEIKKYTSLQEELLKMKVKQENVKEFKKELIKAIKYRLISEVPVGTCLSGGLDSSTIVATVNALIKKRVKEAKSVGKIQKTFSAVFPGSSNDEEMYVDELTRQLTNLRIKVFKVRPDEKEFLREIKEYIKTQEEPTISTGPYAQYKVMEKAKGKVKVLLDGQGSDEMMAGYLPYYFVYFRQLLKEKKYFNLILEAFGSVDILGKYLKEKFSNAITVSSLLNNEFAKKFVQEKFIVESKNLKKRLIEDIFQNSLQSLLRYEDKNAMRFSIEGRVPFLDFNLIRHIFGLPDSSIIRGGWNKYILRRATEGLVPDTINKRRNKIGFTTPEHEWFRKSQDSFMKLFTSREFGERKYFDQPAVVEAFKEFNRGKTSDTMIFWRLINVHLWLKEFFDPSSHKASTGRQKIILGPNKGKKLSIKVGKRTYLRYPVKTPLFKKGDDYSKKISASVTKLLTDKIIKNKKSFVVVSEKIVAISQGRSYFLWEIRPSFVASFLSTFVKRTPYGIGLGSPWTMQLAITEVGLPRILAATIASVLTKAVGISGTFYKIAGKTVRSIDGPTSYSLYPSNVSAKLGPKDPQKAAERIHRGLSSKFQGAVVIDANDLGRNVLGNSTGLPDNLIEEIMADNPMGQAAEQTPIVLVVEK